MIVSIAGYLVEEEDISDIYDQLVPRLRGEGLTGEHLDLALHTAACEVIRSRFETGSMPSLSRH